MPNTLFKYIKRRCNGSYLKSHIFHFHLITPFVKLELLRANLFAYFGCRH